MTDPVELEREEIRLRFALADRLRITMGALDDMPIAEFNLMLVLYGDRAERLEAERNG